MPSKYDPYWSQRINDLGMAFQKAHLEGHASLNVSDIVTYGKRKSWRGTAVVRGRTVLKDDGAMPIRSLASVVADAALLEADPNVYRLQMGPELLEIQLVGPDVRGDGPAPAYTSTTNVRSEGELTTPQPTNSERHQVRVNAGNDQNLLHPTNDVGVTLDATFEVMQLPVFDIIYHHKAGGRNSPRSVNADYHDGLELLLMRMALAHATVLGIAVDSSIARELAPFDRELDLPFPLELSPQVNVADLRRRVTRAQKAVARRPGSQPSGGNDQKRIRITVTFDHMDLDRLRALLARGEGPKSDGGVQSLRPASADRPRTATAGGTRPITKVHLKQWTLEAVRALGGAGTVAEVTRQVWTTHGGELEGSGDLFYTWQYDLRWAAQALRDEGKLAPTERGQGSRWTLPSPATNHRD